jgi:Fe2+ or Zn2+ uptake regulation protein
MAEGAVLGPGGGPLSPLQRAIILCLLDRRGGLSVKALVEFCKKAGEARNSKTIRNNLASLKARGIPIENSPKVGYYLALEDEPPTTP